MQLAQPQLHVHTEDGAWAGSNELRGAQRETGDMNANADLVIIMKLQCQGSELVTWMAVLWSQ
jgi:hypothetical protein